MFGAEFQAKVTNGTIEIPTALRDRFQGQIKVILLANDKPDASNKIAQLLARPLRIDEFAALTREEAHER